ncbi:transcription elongation factor Spt5 [Methanocaldococcus infernus]
MIFAVRTMGRQEKNVALLLSAKAEKENLNVSSILASDQLKGYIFVEVDNEEELKTLIKGVPKVKGYVRGVIPLEEIEPLLSPKKIVEEIEKGDVVEIVAGPFKGERAKVIRVDKNKEEITLELINATVPIPITLPVESIRVVSKKK